MFWALQNSAEAATMQVGATLQLVSTPQYASGDAIPGLPTPTFTSLDPTRVTVNDAGLITAVATTNNPVPVVATLTSGGITNTDTTMVAVTDTRVALKTLSLQVLFGGTVSGDTLYTPISSFVLLSPFATDSSDAPVFGLALKYQVLDKVIANLFDTFLSTTAIGVTKIIVSTNSYGVALADTLILKVGNPMSGSFNICPTCSQLSLPTLTPSVIVIGAGGTVSWNGAETDVTFTTGVDDIPGGAVLHVPAGGQASITFPTTGTYKFTVQVTGDSGSVVVIPNT